MENQEASLYTWKTKKPHCTHGKPRSLTVHMENQEASLYTWKTKKPHCTHGKPRSLTVHMETKKPHCAHGKPRSTIYLALKQLRVTALLEVLNPDT